MAASTETELAVPQTSRSNDTQAEESTSPDMDSRQREESATTEKAPEQPRAATIDVSRRVNSPVTPAKATSSAGSYGDHAPFSPIVLSPSYYDDYGGDFVIYNRMPLKEICLALALLTLGTLGIVFGGYMAYNKVWGDRSHGLIFLFLGALLFIPGFHETRIAYFAWIGYKGFSFGNIPSV